MIDKLSIEQWEAIYNYLTTNYISCKPYEETGMLLDKYYKKICSKGLRALIEEGKINLKKMSIDILKETGFLIPPALLKQISMRVF